jgi:hypothetical protein
MGGVSFSKLTPQVNDCEMFRETDPTGKSLRPKK